MRRSLLGILALVLVALAIVVPTVAAGTGGGTASAPLQSGNDLCGLDIATPPIGTVDFRRNGSALRLDFTLKGAAPNTTYDATLWVPIAPPFLCERISKLGKITTNSKGSGHATFYASASGPIFASVNADGTFNDTPIVDP
jgi:hypothetical protein